jgi:hypothetical protein
MRDEHISFKIQNFQITGLVCVLFYRENMSIFKICKSRSSLLSLICKVADSQRLYCFLSLLLLQWLSILNRMRTTCVRVRDLTYENAKYKITMQYPSDWEIIAGSLQVILQYGYVIVDFASNQSDYVRQDDQNTHNGLEVVVVSIQPIPTFRFYMRNLHHSISISLYLKTIRYIE